MSIKTLSSLTRKIEHMEVNKLRPDSCISDQVVCSSIYEIDTKLTLIWKTMTKDKPQLHVSSPETSSSLTQNIEHMEVNEFRPDICKSDQVV